jgi:hypothetical protein
MVFISPPITVPRLGVAVIRIDVDPSRGVPTVRSHPDSAGAFVMH